MDDDSSTNDILAEAFTDLAASDDVVMATHSSDAAHLQSISYALTAIGKLLYVMATESHDSVVRSEGFKGIPGL